jgi:hypothetical protein
VLITAIIVVFQLLFDKQAFKEKFTQELSKTIGEEIKINGDIGISLLPFPNISVESISFDKQYEQRKIVVTANEVVMDLELIPLFWKEINITNSYILDPKITVTGYSSHSDQNDLFVVFKKIPDNIQVIINNGSVVYPDFPKNNVEKISLSIINSGNSSNLNGNLMLNKKKYSFNGVVSENGSLIDTNFNIGTSIFDIRYNGTIDLDLTNANGKITIGIHDVADLVAEYTARDKNPVFINSDKTVSITSEVKYSDNIINIDNFTIKADSQIISIPESNKNNILINTKGQQLFAEANMVIDFLNLDILLSQTDLTSTSFEDFNIPEVTFLMGLTVGTVQYHHNEIKNVKLGIHIAGNTMGIEPFNMELAGNTKIEIDGILSKPPVTFDNARSIPIINGTIKAYGDNIFNAASMFIDFPDFINTTEDKDFFIKSDFRMIPYFVELANIKSIIDSSLISGTLNIKHGNGIPIIYGKMNLNGIDLDNYINTSSNSFDNTFSWVSNIGYNLDLETYIQKFQYNNISFDNMDSSIVISNNRIALEKLNINSDKLTFESHLIIDTTKLIPYVDFDIQAKKIDLTAFQNNDKASINNNISGSYLELLESYNGVFKIRIDELIGKSITVKNIESDGTIDMGSLQFPVLSTETMGGKIILENLNLKFNSGVLVLTTTCSVKNVDFDSLLSKAIGVKNHSLSGKISIAGSLASSGSSISRLLQDMQGNFVATMRPMVIKNIDIKNIQYNLLKSKTKNEAKAILKNSINNGETEFYSVDGYMSLKNGVLTLGNKETSIIMSAKKNYFSGSLNGYINFNDDSLQINNIFQFGLIGEKLDNSRLIDRRRKNKLHTLSYKITGKKNKYRVLHSNRNLNRAIDNHYNNLAKNK